MVRAWGVVLWVLVLVVALAVAMRFAPPVRAQGTEGLVLNEILAGPARDWDGDGAFDARGDEWVEIKNNGVAAVDLGAYRLSDADSTIRFAFSGSLGPGNVVLVTGTAALDWQRAVGRTATGLSLNNAGDTVRLFRIEGADTTAIDVKAYNSIEGGTDRSTGKFGAGWSLFDALNAYTGSGEPKGTGRVAILPISRHDPSKPRIASGLSEQPDHDRPAHSEGEGRSRNQAGGARCSVPSPPVDRPLLGDGTEPAVHCAAAPGHGVSGVRA